MKIIFAGTPAFAAKALQTILAHQHNVLAVLTQPDRPSGRGMKLTASPVKILAEHHNIEVLQPQSLKSSEVQQQLADYRADVMIVAAYGLILPLQVLKLPRYGCLNIHASLLPRWRGAAPIQRAILAGDEVTGITIIQMDAGLDTGDMLLKKVCPILPSDTAQTLLDKMTNLGADAIIEVIQQLQYGKLSATVQDSGQATYANKITKDEACLNWDKSAEQLERAVRAYNPFPIAYAKLHNIHIKIWQAEMHENMHGKPGEILAINEQGIFVACGQGALCLKKLQRPNGKVLLSNHFLQGFTMKAGHRFDMH